MTKRIPIGVILACFGLLGMPTVWAKTCAVTVSVEDFVTKQGVEGAVVEFKRAETNATVLARETNGKYLSEELSAGLYLLSVLKDGFKSSTKRILLACSKATDSTMFETSIYLLTGDSRDRIHVIDKDLAGVIAAKVGMNDLAVELPKPKYPGATLGKSGTVLMRVLINEDGSVQTASAVGGSSVFWEAAEQAALKARFIPSVLNGKPTNVTATITYRFVP